MARKHINSSSGAVLGQGPTYKKKVVPYKEPQLLRDIRLNRERLFWMRYPEQRKEIEEYVNYMKSQWALQDKREI
jgi:hypothetical protein